MGYSGDEDMVRVDFFRASGKWYTTEEMKWTGGYSDCSIFCAFAQSLRDAFGQRYTEMDAVCLHPYHDHEHPIQMRQGEWMTWDDEHTGEDGVGETDTAGVCEREEGT